MRRQARIDANQPQIVQGLRKCGYSVAITSGVGGGFPDIVVGARGRSLLFEIKDPDQSASGRKLTEDERQFHMTWMGQIAIIETLEDALKIINAQTLEPQRSTIF